MYNQTMGILGASKGAGTTFGQLTQASCSECPAPPQQPEVERELNRLSETLHDYIARVETLCDLARPVLKPEKPECDTKCAEDGIYPSSQVGESIRSLSNTAAQASYRISRVIERLAV